MNALARLMLKRLGRTAPPPRSSGVPTKAIEWTPGAERVLVLAPHMDDEVIGCGGALALHAKRGGMVVAAFMTDGCAGADAIHRLKGSARERAELELTRIRKEEARRALAQLGVHTLAFLDARDGELAGSMAAIDRLRQLLIETRPQIVYLPFYTDEHADHRATSGVLLQAMEEVDAQFQCFAYEVWTPLTPNCLIRIDEAVDAKRRALQAYASQVQRGDYVHAALGLNAHRSIGLAGARNGYAEAFHVAPVDEYLEQYLTYCAWSARVDARAEHARA